MQHYISLAVLILSSCTGRPLEVRGENLHIVGTTRTSSVEEMEGLLDVGEALHADIAALHPSELSLEPEVRVELHGRFRNESPYVDDDGTMHLWRFSDGEGGYRALFAHELVHAIAYDSAVAPILASDWETGGGFYLEGWAEYAALVVDPDKTGFPLFGFNEDVVVGHWLDHGGPSLATLRASHEELSLKCQGQSYILRASWYRYVHEELGRDVLMDLVAAREGLGPDAVEAVLGTNVEKVDADWAAWAQARYEAHEGADAEAAAFHAQITGWYVPCVE